MRNPFSPKWKRTWNCLDVGKLAAFVDGSLAPAECGGVESHLSKCQACRESVATLVRSERKAVGAVPPAWLARVRHLGDASPSRAGMRWAWAGAMACLLLVAAGITVFPRQPRQQEIIAVSHAPLPTASVPRENVVEHDEVRTIAVPSIGPVVTAPHDGARLARDAQVTWQPLPSAVGYEVRVLDAAGDTVWHTRTNAVHLQIPANASLQAGKRYFVLISASLPAGKTVHARAVSFQVEANQEDR